MRTYQDVFLVAEVGSVHDGSIGNEKALIDLCAHAGVDAVKFQTHISKAETIKDAPTPPGFTGEPRYTYFERTGYSETEWADIYRQCIDANVEFMSAPFSEEAVDLLDRIGMQRYKIPSGEITNLPMIEKIAQTKKPIILSTGMSFFEEIDAAVEVIRKSHDNITILQCTSAYPCDYERVGLNVISDLQSRYDVAVGLSDHTPTNYASFAAVALGATYIEKHVTFSRQMYGSDAANAVEPHELEDLVKGVRAINEMATCRKTKEEITETVKSIKPIFEKSIVTVKVIRKGQRFSQENVALKKPGHGIPPKNFSDIVGKTALREIPADSVVSEEDVGW